MFITPDTIASLKKSFGQPHEQSFDIKVTVKEHDFIQSTQKHGRMHDVTLYIKKENEYFVIAKHFYPPDLYRAPSGGINPGEDFIVGAKREALEETGCEIRLSRFILLTNVNFYVEDEPDKRIEWHSYVFLADYISGDFKFTDKHEIREVRLAKLEEFDGYSKIMRSTDIGGLHYRAALHDAVKKLL